MADEFNIPSLKDLPQTLVDATTSMIASRLAEYNPDIDFNRRASFVLLSYLHGLLLAGTSQNLIQSLSTNNLASLMDGSATDDQADEIAKAFNITRRPSQVAKVYVLIVLTNAVPFALSPADTISFGNINFAVETSVNVRVSSSTISSASDYVLTRIGTGKWGVVIPVAAKVTGSSSNLPPGTALSCSRQITSLSKMMTSSTLQIGIDEETNQQMADRVLEAVSVQTWASRSSFEAMARQSTTYSDLVGISVCGYGDPEQRRDRRGVLPVGHGGRTDLWVKFRPGLYYAQVQVTASLLSKVGSLGTWIFTLNGATYPATGKIVSVVPVDDQSGNTFEPVSTVWSLGTPVGVVNPRYTGERYIPDVKTVIEAAYSAYNNTTVMFEDDRYDVTSLDIGTTRSYLANISFEPLVETYQQELGSAARSNPAGDVLVRAAIPCEVTATVTIRLYPGKASPSEADVASAVVSFINSTKFPGAISASDLSSACGTAVGGAGTIVVSYLSGTLKKPDGTMLSLQMSDGKIEVPDYPIEMVTRNTVAFYTDNTRVSVVISS